MGMFDDNELNTASEGSVNSENKFEAAGDCFLEDYINEIEEPKQEQQEPFIPNDEEYLKTSEVTPVHNKEQLKTSEETALFVVETFDDILSLGVAAYAHEPNSDVFAANKEKLTEIAKHLSVYFAENSFNLPPWAMAAIPGMMVISSKFNMAGKLRKSNLEKKKAENELSEVKRELERVKLEKQVAEAKIELSKLKDE